MEYSHGVLHQDNNTSIGFLEGEIGSGVKCALDFISRFSEEVNIVPMGLKTPHQCDPSIDV